MVFAESILVFAFLLVAATLILKGLHDRGLPSSARQGRTKASVPTKTL